MDFRILDVRQDLKIVTLFMITQFLGLLVATQVYAVTPIVVLQGTSVNATVGASLETAVIYIAAIVAFALLIVLLLGKYKGTKAFLIFEGVVVVYTTFFLFLIVIGELLNLAGQPYLLGATAQVVLALLMSIALILAKNKWPRLRNMTTILSCIGIGLIIGLYLDFLTIFIFIIILAVYDYVAVFITKHMVVMGQTMASMNMAFMIGASDVEGVPAGQLTRQEKETSAKHRQMLKQSYGTMVRQLDKQQLSPIIGQRLLGNGDLAVPLMAAVSAYKLFQNFTASMAIILGAVLGLVLTFYILSKYRRPLPAIPPLLLGMSIGLVVYLVLAAV